MTATAAQIAQVRRMVAEPTTTTYSDDDIKKFIENYPLVDELGTDPYYWDTSGSGAPTKTTNTTWVSTYDLNAAAANIWEEKAAAVAALYDFNADGGNFSRSQRYDQYMAMARRYWSKSTIKSVTVISKPDETTTTTRQPWIINLSEPDDPPGYETMEWQ